MRIEYARNQQQCSTIAAEISSNRDIVIVGTNSSDGGEDRILNALEQNTKVLSVRILNFKPSRVLIEALIGFLSNNDTVKTFELGLPPGSSASPESARALINVAKALRANRSITSFRIENFSLQNEPEIVTVLAGMISAAGQLSALSLFNCNVGAQEIKGIYRGIQQNDKFRLLHIQEPYWNSSNIQNSRILDDLRGDRRSTGFVLRYKYNNIK